MSPVAPAVDARVGPDDLARAVVAMRPDLLEPLAGPALARASAMWRARIEPGDDRELAEAWGRRWVLGAGSIGVETMMRSLPPHTLWARAALDPGFDDGLVTQHETRDRLLDGLGARELNDGDVRQ